MYAWNYLGEIRQEKSKLYKDICNKEQKSFSVLPSKIEKLIPKGYTFRKSKDDYSVAHINSDGMDDILVKIYPINKNYVYRGDYPKGSPYRKSNLYGYNQLWVLEGKENEKYKQKKLMDSIDWDETFQLSGIKAFEGGFTMEYFVGRSPFQTILRKFKYHKEKKDWYLAVQYENSSVNIKGIPYGFMILGPREFGEEYLLSTKHNPYYKVTLNEGIND